MLVNNAIGGSSVYIDKQIDVYDGDEMISCEALMELHDPISFHVQIDAVLHYIGGTTKMRFANHIYKVRVCGSKIDGCVELVPAELIR